MSSFSRNGYASKIVFTESPADKYCKMVSTVILIPLMVGLPLQTSGLMVILSKTVVSIVIIFTNLEFFLYKIRQPNSQNYHRNFSNIKFMSFATFENNSGRNME